jgi:hypothetical protein
VVGVALGVLAASVLRHCSWATPVTDLKQANRRSSAAEMSKMIRQQQAAFVKQQQAMAQVARTAAMQATVEQMDIQIDGQVRRADRLRH